MALRERGARNAFICDVSLPLHWEREFAPRLLLSVGVDPDITDTRDGWRYYSFSFNTKKSRKTAVRNIAQALVGLERIARVSIRDGI